MISAEYNQIVEYLQLAEQSMYSAQDIKARFESEPAAVYGQTMASWIPDYAYTHQLLLESLAIHLPTHAKGVDLGAGSGRVAKLLCSTFPNFQLTLVDISANMLREAERQLAGYAGRCQFLVRDIFDTNLEFPKGSLDCVVSVFAICHAQGIEVYEQLYQRIYHWLKPQGYFVCYDHVLGDTFQWKDGSIQSYPTRTWNMASAMPIPLTRRGGDPAPSGFYFSTIASPTPMAKDGVGEAHSEVGGGQGRMAQRGYLAGRRSFPSARIG